MTSSPSLLRCEPRELCYAPDISSQVLRLTNTSPNSRLAFKIRSNRAHRYRLSHVAGVLLPAASVDVTIELATTATATGVGGIRPAVTEQLDKFLVTAALVPASGAEYRTAAAAALWNNDGVAGAAAAAAAATGAAQRQQVRSRVLPARVSPAPHVLLEPTQPPPQHPPPPLPRVEVEPAAVEARQIISGRGAVLCLRNRGAAPVAFRFQVPSPAVLAVQPAMGLIAGGVGGTTSVRVTLSADASREGRAAAGTSHSHSSHANGDTAGAGSSRLRLSVMGLDRSSGALWYAAGAGGRTAGVDDGGGGDAGALIYAAALRRLWRRVDGDASAAPGHRKEARVWSHIVHVSGVGEEVHEEESGACSARHPRSGTRRTPPLSSRPRDGSCAAAAAVSCVSPCDQFKCPITQELMRSPVATSSGMTYERVAIEHWLATHSKDPMTNEALPSKALVPVLALRQLIAQWQEQQQRLRLRQQPAAAAADSTGHHAADQCGVTTDARDSRPLGDHTNFSR